MSFCFWLDWQRKRDRSVGFCLFTPRLRNSAAGKLALLLTGTYLRWKKTWGVLLACSEDGMEVYNIKCERLFCNGQILWRCHSQKRRIAHRLLKSAVTSFSSSVRSPPSHWVMHSLKCTADLGVFPVCPLPSVPLPGAFRDLFCRTWNWSVNQSELKWGLWGLRYNSSQGNTALESSPLFTTSFGLWMDMLWLFWARCPTQKLWQLYRRLWTKG